MYLYTTPETVLENFNLKISEKSSFDFENDKMFSTVESTSKAFLYTSSA